MVASPEIRKRRNEKASSSPKGPLKEPLEAPKISSPSVEREEVKFV